MCKYLESRSRSASIQQYALKSFVGSDGTFPSVFKKKKPFWVVMEIKMWVVMDLSISF